MPGHVNAALASYGSLNCDGQPEPLYTGTNVGFSSLCVPKPVTYTFINDVMAELAALTPGPYLHFGGDEASSTRPSDYATFVPRVQQIIQANGKTAIGWHNIVAAPLSQTTIAEYWDTTPHNPSVAAATHHGTRVVMAPANLAYLDMKYNPQTPLGQNWAGYIPVSKAYDWDPGNLIVGADPAAILGVEGPVWTETMSTLAEIEYMAFPRLPALAELGWSPWSTHDWNHFRVRLGAQAPLWSQLGINYYHSPQIPWK
jgi:hexosaminidase